MRVISGAAKGHILKTIDTKDTRPTTDRVKEALFNILNPYIFNSSVLDLFAGSGALGIEALSRGAKEAVFVEQSKNAVEYIKQNLIHTKLVSLGEIKLEDVQNYIKNTSRKFDLIFMDPPYYSDVIPNVISSIDRSEILNPGGIIVAECDQLEEMPENVSRFNLYDKRKYGRVLIYFYKKF